MPPPPPFDVFVSYSHADVGPVATLVEAMQGLGLRVWIDATGVRTFDPIHERVAEGIAGSRVLLAWYSHRYARSRPCQWELACAWRCEAGARVFVVNPEPDDAHIQPRSLLHRAYADAADPPATARAVHRGLAAFATAIGEAGAAVQPLHHGRQFSGSNRFVGRTGLLWAVHDALSSAQAPMLTATARSVVQLRGFGGVGKSLLAEEYAMRFGAGYPGGIFWLKGYGHDAAGAAMSPEDRAAEREGQLADFASRLHIPVAGRRPADIRAALAQVLASGRRSLWIVDDMPGGTADDAEAWLSPHPSVPTLITTRDGSLGSLGVAIDVDALSEDEALALFELHRPLQDGERAPARDLLAALGRHALAVEVAAASLEGEPSEAIAAFVEALRHPGADVLEQAAELADALPLAHSPSIVATLSGTVARLGTPARDLLYLAACVAAAPLPAALVEAVFARLAGPGEATFLRQKAVKETQRYGLSRREDGARGEAASSVHTLVARTAARQSGAGERLARVRAAALGALADILHGLLSPGASVRHARSITHAQAIASPLSDGDEAALMVRVANAHLQRGDLETADRLARRALAFEEARPDGDELARSRARSGVAVVLLARGEAAAALRLFDEVLPVFERALPEGDVFRVGAALGCALAQTMCGDPAGAVARAEAALASCTAVNGAAHPLTLNACTTLALLLFAHGDPARATALQHQVVEARRQAAETGDLDSLLDQFVLAQWGTANGDIEPFAPVIDRAAVVFPEALGADSALTLQARLLLLMLLAQRGDWPAARAVSAELMPRFERVLGAGNPATLQARSIDAMVLLVQDRVSEARALLEPIVAQLRVLLGARHAAVGQVEVFLAATLAEQARYDEAEALLAQVLPAGPQDPGVAPAVGAFACAVLADCRAGRGDAAGACALREQVVAIEIGRFGAGHPAVLGAQVRLAQQLAGANDEQRCCDLLCAVLPDAEARLGPQHATTRAAKGCLALALQRLAAPATTPEGWDAGLAIADRHLQPTDPARLMLAVSHAQAMLRMGAPARCLDAVEAALPHAVASLDADDPTIRHLRTCRAVALQRLGRIDEAAAPQPSPRTPAG